MESLPHFIRLLKDNQLINAAVTTGKLNNETLRGLSFTRNAKNKVTLKNFDLGGHEHFEEVTILMSNFGVLIDLISSDTKYFENAQLYFNTKAVARSKPAYIKKGKTFQVKGKKIGKFNIFSKTVYGSVMRSDLYGCKIMISFYSEKAPLINRPNLGLTESEFLSNMETIR